MLQRLFDFLERRLLLMQIAKLAGDIHHEELQHRTHQARMECWFGEIAALKACVADLERPPLRLKSWLSMSRGDRREQPACQRFVSARIPAIQSAPQLTVPRSIARKVA